MKVVQGDFGRAVIAYCDHAGRSGADVNRLPRCVNCPLLDVGDAEIDPTSQRGYLQEREGQLF